MSGAETTNDGSIFDGSTGLRSLYQRLGVPVPSVSPDERARRRLSWRNERNFYRRSCSATGKSIVSIFDDNAPFPVFDQRYWWSDNWDARAYGREYDFSLPFIVQFLRLFNVVPQMSLRGPQSENSEYTNQCEQNKDCYILTCSGRCRDCLYGMWLQSCVDCIDCCYLENCELCYELSNGERCYHCFFSRNLRQCADCVFCRDLIGCSSCFGCVNLRQKKHCFFNQQLSPEAYRAQLAQYHLGSRTVVEALGRRFAEFSLAQPVKYYSGSNIESSSGDYLEQCRSAVECFNCRHCEQLFYGRDAWKARNCVDLTETFENDFCIELEGCYKNVNCGFSAKISETHDTWYSSHCFNCHDLFGCVGLRQKRYCILNQQYKEVDYRALRKRIIEQMGRTGEWGQYFPLRSSPFAYNESVAQEYFPVGRNEAELFDLRWKDPVDLPAAEIEITEAPADIDQADERLLSAALRCPESGRLFKLQAGEFAFYRRERLPVPLFHYDRRHQKRMAQRNPRRLQPGSCRSCGAGFKTTADSRAAIVLCENCYGAV